MIDPARFVSAARARGFARYAGVPCSFLTPFIDHVLQDPALHYLSAANEGDAVAYVAGLALASSDGRRGVTMMQNSGLGNAVSPLTSLTWTFRLPQLLIVTWRGQPGVADEPQHALMGPITPTMLDTMEVAWELFPTEDDAIVPALDRAVAHMDRTGRPYALLMQKGSVAAGAAAPPAADRHRPHVTAVDGGASGPAPVPSRRDALARIVAATPMESTIVVASTGFCGRELYAIDDRPNQLYMVGSMGCASSFALGVALARPDLTIVAIDGDGAALMRLGAFATIGAYGPSNLIHVLLDNGVHDSTGGQATVSPNVAFAAVAAACGYGAATEAKDLDALADAVADVVAGPVKDGSRFVRIVISSGASTDLPRPTISPVDVKRRLMRHIAPVPAAA